MTDLVPKMHEAVKSHVMLLSVARGISRGDALGFMATSYQENLADSAGSTMVPYWRLMLEVVDREIAENGRPA